MKEIIATRDLTMSVRKKPVIAQVSLHICQGEIYGLVEKNDKSRQMIVQLLLGNRRPDSGEILLFGQPWNETEVQTGRVGAVFPRAAVYPKLTVRQNLEQKRMALGIARQKVLWTMEAVGLDDAAEKQARHLNTTQALKLCFAMALVSTPDLILIDQFGGKMAEQFCGLIHRLNQEYGITFLLVGSSVTPFAGLATCYGMMYDGKLLQEMSQEEMDDVCRQYVDFRVSNASKAVAQMEQMGIAQYKVIDSDTIRMFERFSERGSIAASLDAGGIGVTEMILRNESPEEYYLRLAQKEQL